MAVSFTGSVKERLTFRALIICSLLSGSGISWLLAARSRKCSYLSMPWDFWIIFTVLGVALPWRGQYRLRRLLELPEVGSRERIALYLSTIAFQWAALAITAWRAQARGLSLADLGLGRGRMVGLLAAGILGGAVLGGLHWLNLRRIARGDLKQTSRLRAVSQRILPRSKVELVPYFALALTAGFCEEFLYRGFSMAALFGAGLPTALVVLVSSVLFGLAHLYQGRSGLLGTLVLGTVFGLARIAYDSIVPVMFWHAAVDVVAGVAGPRYFLTSGR